MARLIVISAVVAETLHVERRQHRGDIDDPKSESARSVCQVVGLARELLRFAGSRGTYSNTFSAQLRLPCFLAHLGSVQILGSRSLFTTGWTRSFGSPKDRRLRLSS